ncbi:MAG: serine--tRNA ligase [Candidatus Eremiobacteraeota bacterium]|nr:serine--tRNA ligase [Candidatus Eremiobacteraeota bacterium]MBV9737185.1 serine--tRNA ligase [Candidatus Eremiobacteraeota bacterium]
MLDINLIRRDPDRVRRSCERRGIDPSSVDEILRLDEQYRSAQTAVQTLLSQKNAHSATIARADDKAEAAKALRPQLDDLAQQIAAAEERAEMISPQRADSPLRALLENLPNILDSAVPDGKTEEDNVEVRRVGTPRAFDFEVKPHWTIGESLGILDFERAAKLAGSRFGILIGDGARLSRALIDFFLDRARAKSYVEVVPPYLVTRRTMWSTGQLTKFSDAMFCDPEADLFMIPTSEVPLTALHGEEILSIEDLPRRYAAYSPCFRKEAGAAGKDTRGLMRQHQFEKVELVWLTVPESSGDVLDSLTADAEALLSELELSHRVVALCAGEIGFNSAKTYDVEVWIPSEGRYREISSCSNCTDFQARRADIRFRRDPKKKPEFVHTLNGSGLAVGRTLIAILENYQQADGSITIPLALRSYFNGEKIERSST